MRLSSLSTKEFSSCPHVCPRFPKIVFHLSVQYSHGGAVEEEGEEKSTPTHHTSSMDEGAESWTIGSSESEDLTFTDSERIVGQSTSTVNDECRSEKKYQKSTSRSSRPTTQL